jgi:hypothetical protein
LDEDLIPTHILLGSSCDPLVVIVFFIVLEALRAIFGGFDIFELAFLTSSTLSTFGGFDCFN